MDNPDIFVIAGEASGDQHSAELIRNILKINNNIIVSGIGGSRLKKQGVQLLYDYSEINYIGFVDIAKNYFKLKKKLHYTAKKILELSPKVLILCDFPGFNLRIADRIRKRFKGKIFYYITPQVWAWHKNRVKSLKRNTDACFTILPFEKEILEKENIVTFYAGNPVLQQCREYLKNSKRERLEQKVISIMPGTRKEEVSRILPILIDISRQLISKYHCKINLIASDNISKNIYKRYINNNSINIIKSNKDSNLTTIYNSDFVITKFGTSNLECSFLGVPFVAVYKASYLNYLIAKTLVNLKYVSLVNIVMNKSVVREYIQSDFTSSNIINEVERVFSDDSYRNNMLEDFILLKSKFEKEITNISEYISKEI